MINSTCYKKYILELLPIGCDQDCRPKENRALFPGDENTYHADGRKKNFGKFLEMDIVKN